MKSHTINQLASLYGSRPEVTAGLNAAPLAAEYAHHGDTGLQAPNEAGFQYPHEQAAGYGKEVGEVPLRVNALDLAAHGLGNFLRSNHTQDPTRLGQDYLRNTKVVGLSAESEDE